MCCSGCLGCSWISGIDKQEKTDVHYRSVHILTGPLTRCVRAFVVILFVCLLACLFVCLFVCLFI